MADGMDDAEKLPPARNENLEAIADMILRVEGILDNEEDDRRKTTEIGDLLRKGALDPAVAECFCGDGNWDPKKKDFDAWPVWDCVRTALAILKTTVLAENRTVHSQSPHALYLRPP